MKTILVAGGSGFIGKALIERLVSHYKVINVSRSLTKKSSLPNIVQWCEWSDNQQLVEAVKQADIIVNLSGETINAIRWTKQKKERILHSRTQATETLVNLAIKYNPECRLINASAIGVYGNKQNNTKKFEAVHTEKSDISENATDFLAEVGRAWEQPLDQAVNHGLKIVKLRFGVVLSAKGGMLSQLLLPYKLGLGGIIGSGKQMLSWIALEDLLGIMLAIIKTDSFLGAINLVAPDVVSQEQFSKTLASLLHRPAFFHMPSLIIRTLFGEMGDTLLLSGQTVVSKRLDELPYRLKYPHLREALEAILK